MKVVLVEFACHDELILPFLKVLERSEVVDEIDLFTSTNILDRAFGQNISSIKKLRIVTFELHEPRRKNIISFKYIRYLLCRRKVFSEALRQISCECDSNTVIIVQTFSFSMFSWESLKILDKLRKNKTKIILGMHNSYEWKIVPESERIKINLYKRRTSPFLKNVLEFIFSPSISKLRCRLLKDVDGFLTISRNIELPCSVPYIVIPTKLHTEDMKQKRISIINNPRFFEKCRIVIPGTVDNKRKDYDSLIEAFGEFIKKYNISNLFLVFLGKMSSSSIEKKLKKSEARGKILTYRNYIGISTYENIILKSHFVLVNPTFIPPYGKYKISGGEVDAKALGIPLIIPKSYYIDPLFSESTIVYNNLIDMFEQVYSLFINPSRYLDLAYSALSNANFYSVECLASTLDNALLEINNQKHILGQLPPDKSHELDN